jgi:allantoin racemase
MPMCSGAMKIILINPNSDPAMTARIQETAERFAQGRFEVLCRTIPDAPRFIETYGDIHRAGPGMAAMIRELEQDFDGFVVACHYDPHLDTLKEITAKPVAGIGEASLRIATMLGHRFSLITTDEHSLPLQEDLIRKYHLTESTASILAPTGPLLNLPEEERCLALARQAIEQDGAEVIILGCAGLSGLENKIRAELGVPAIDGVACALFIVEGLVRYGIGTSKARRYNPNRDSE